MKGRIRFSIHTWGGISENGATLDFERMDAKRGRITGSCELESTFFGFRTRARVLEKSKRGAIEDLEQQERKAANNRAFLRAANRESR